MGGDFNLEHPSWGTDDLQHRWNGTSNRQPQATRLAELIAEQQWTILNNVFIPHEKTHSGLQGTDSVIDLVLTNSQDICASMELIHEAEFTSDHTPLKVHVDNRASC